MAAKQANVGCVTENPGLTPPTVLVMAGGGPTNARPANPTKWFHYYNTDTSYDQVWDGSTWQNSNGGPQGPQGIPGPQGPGAVYGPTTMRPVNPTPYQRYYDTDILAEIWWERGAWRTVAGVPGDVKIVEATNLTAALNSNPGWVQDTVVILPTQPPTVFRLIKT